MTLKDSADFFKVSLTLNDMKKVWLTFVFYICIDRIVLGSPTLTCDDVDPVSPSTVQCTCTHLTGLGIQWYTGGVSVTQCILSSEMCFSATGYTFSANSTTSKYTIAFGSYLYTNCINVSCSDLVDTSDYSDKDISVKESSLTPNLVISEPTSNHTNGNITVSTDCVYKARSKFIIAKATWKAIINEKKEMDLDVETYISKTGSCPYCSKDFSSQFVAGFYHTEDTGEGKIEAKIQLVLTFVGTSFPPLNKTTENYYYVDGTNETSISNNVTSITSILKSSSTTSSAGIKGTAATPERYVSSVVKSETWCIISEDEIVCIHIIWVVIVAGCSIIAAVVVVVCIKVKKGSAQEEFYAIKVEKTSIKVCWKRCDKNQSSKRVYILNLSNNNPIEITDDGEKNFFHTFSNLQHSTFYYITLKCADKANLTTIYKIYKTLKVRTKGVPEAPSNFRVEKHDVTESSIRVRWKPGDDGGSRQTFVLTCSTKDRNTEIEHKGEKDMSYEWDNLSEGTYYDLGMCARSTEGSTRIQPLKKRTLGKPDPPTNLKAEQVTDKSMKVIWTGGSNGGYTQSFKLFVLNNSGEHSEEHKVHERNEISDYHVLLKYLIPSTDYTLNLKSENVKGVVECIAPLVVRTKGRPSKPKDFRYEDNDITDTSITVRWNPGSDGGCKQTFVVTISCKGKLIHSEKIEDNGSKESWLKRWTLLSKATYYDISIFAENTIGQSKTQTRSIKTLAGKPNPPTKFRIVEGGVTETSIKVKWEPGHDGGYEQRFYVIIDKNEYLAKENGTYTCKSLTPSTYYDIELKARNEKGEVYAKPLRHIRTAGPPDPPAAFEIVSKTNSTITVKWEPGYDGGFPQHFILVDVTSGKKLTDPIKDTVEDTVQHIITNLEEGMEFKLQVQSSNDMGTSSSKIKEVKTKTTP